MTDLYLHNTLTGKKEKLEPLVPRQVGLYVCGITPYDETHLGHARCYVVFDVLKRVLQHHGYDVNHFQNFTDVDDKIIERANKAGIPPDEYPKPFMESFKAYMAQLNVLPPKAYPLVTTHIPDIIKLIERLVANGYAYELEGSVYYSVRKFGDDYTRLSKRKLDDLEVGARVQVDEKKRDPLDFALWKKSKEGEPCWNSPWGNGRPGWHIECSAMSTKYLGEEFDIHGGGLDLIFPHHTNEIAQSVAASGKPFDKSFAKIWMHNGFVTINQEKMSKSLGNFFTIKDILAKFDPMAVRYFLLTQHYRSPLNFSDLDLEAAAKTWRDRICGAYRLCKDTEMHTDFHFKNEDIFWDSLKNDLNTPAALAELNNVCAAIFLAEKGQFPADMGGLRVVLKRMLEGLGLLPTVEESWPEEILALAKERETARENKEWRRSDELREALKKKGVLVEDTSSGPRLKRI